MFTVAPLQSSLAGGGGKLGEAVQSMVASAPAGPIGGTCVSIAEMPCVLVCGSLPQASVASHVLVYIFTHELAVVVVDSMFTVAPLQSSLAVGGVKLGEAVQSMVASAPAAPIVGTCVSIAEMTCGLVAEWLSQASVASHVLVYIFTHELAVVVVDSMFTVAPLQSSLAVGGVKLGEAVQSMVASAPAAPIVGTCVSIAEMTCALVAE